MRRIDTCFVETTYWGHLRDTDPLKIHLPTTKFSGIRGRGGWQCCCGSREEQKSMGWWDVVHYLFSPQHDTINPNNWPPLPPPWTSVGPINMEIASKNNNDSQVSGEIACHEQRDGDNGTHHGQSMLRDEIQPKACIKWEGGGGVREGKMMAS